MTSPPPPEPPDHPTMTLAGAGGGVGVALAAGDLVNGRFRIVRPLGEGGMGVVYLAEDEKLGQPRAIKFAKLGHAHQLNPEARAALSVTHPNVCRVFEIHSAATTAGEIDFLSMEYVEGGSLWRRLRDRGAPPEPEARRLAIEICNGLAACHESGVLHRDLKSNNVLLAGDGDAARALVTDFGLARENAPPEAAAAEVTHVAGTPAYLAPERWQGKPASIASDVYALGVVLHELIAGRRPEAGKLAPNLPPRWRAVIARCLDADPARRYASAAAVAEALGAKSARRRWLAAGLAASLFAAAAIYWTRTPPPAPARLAVLPIETAVAELQPTMRGASFDLSARLSRLNPRPPGFTAIPIEETQALPSGEAARERLGASHLLRASVTRQRGQLRLRGQIVDAATQVTTRELDIVIGLPGEISPRLLALIAAAFNLPRQEGREEIAPAAYAAYAEGMAHLRGIPLSSQRALASFERAIAADPDSPLPAAGAAEACYATWQTTQDPKLLERGRAELARVAARHPDSLAIHLAAGKLNLSPGAYARAAQEYQRALQIDPANGEAWRGLARSYENIEARRPEAAQAYLKAIELQPDYYLPLGDFADFQRRGGNYREAESLWLRALKLAPQSATLHSNLGGLYSDMGRWEDAERELKRAIELNPRFRSALNNLAAHYQYRGRDADAAPLLERARTLGPETYIVNLNLGDSYRRMGNGAQARAAYQRGLELAEKQLLADPSDAPARAFVAYFLLRTGNTAAAQRELTQALHFGGKDRTVIRRAVISYEAMRQRDRALAVLETASRDLLLELSRQPDLTGLQADSRFRALLSPP